MMKSSAIVAILLAIVSLRLAGCAANAESHEETHPEAHSGAEHHDHQIVATAVIRKDVVSTQQYVAQIHSCKHIEVRALERGYLEELHVNEGQGVKQGELMFKIVPVVYQAKLNSEIAEAKRIEIELKNAKSLSQKGIVSSQEVALKEAEWAKANANVDLARAELNFTDIRAPFNGIVDRQRAQLGSLIDEGDVLTTLSDNSVMWVYFNVPESRYLEYKAEIDKGNADAEQLHIELELANGEIFPYPGKIGAIEADFNNTTGNIAFRADFPNPDGLLRNGQTGTILIHRTLQDVVVIPQRATFEILDKRYAYVLDQNKVVHQRDIEIQSEQEDIFVVKAGLQENEKIILEGIRQVRDGETAECEFRDPNDVLSNLKYHAE
jgi:membrane fusion protein (multidrug efflux system)